MVVTPTICKKRRRSTELIVSFAQTKPNLFNDFKKPRIFLSNAASCFFFLFRILRIHDSLNLETGKKNILVWYKSRHYVSWRQVSKFWTNVLWTGIKSHCTKFSKDKYCLGPRPSILSLAALTKMLSWPVVSGCFLKFAHDSSLYGQMSSSHKHCCFCPGHSSREKVQRCLLKRFPGTICGGNAGLLRTGATISITSLFQLQRWRALVFIFCPVYILLQPPWV